MISFMFLRLAIPLLFYMKELFFLLSGFRLFTTMGIAHGFRYTKNAALKYFRAAALRNRSKRD